MNEKGKKAGSTNVDATHLLGRGSRILGLAGVAGACGQRAGKGPWHVLSKETVGPAEEVLSALEKNPDPVLLESAVRAALEDVPATALPAWTNPIVDRSFDVSLIGQAIDSSSVSKVITGQHNVSSARTKGLAALAMGFCRSRDNLDSISAPFDKNDRIAVQRMGALANVIVGPGEPSRIRKFLRTLLEQRTEVIDG